MDVKIEAYETMRKALEKKFADAFETKWSAIIMNNVNEVADELKEKEYGCKEM